MAVLIIYQIFVVLTFSILSSSFSFEHVLLIWEHKDFKGESGYVVTRNHNCVTLVPEWRNRVSSIDTSRHCYQIYEGKNCDKSEAYVYPMSKHHNDLSSIEMNDKINSIRLCVLDEQSLDNSSVPLDKSRPEFAFWDFTFGKTSVSDQRAFRHLVAKHHYGYIPWNFIPGIRGTLPVAEQYQAALDWFIAAVQDQRFKITDLNQMRKMSYQVFDERANRNAARKPTPALGSRVDAISFQLEVYWKRIVEAIDTELERIMDELEKPKKQPSPQKISQKSKSQKGS